MTTRLLVDVDSNGVAEYAHFDTDGNLVGLQFQSDVEDVIENNKRLKNDDHKGYGASRDWRHIASIDPAMLLKWAELEGVSPAFINTREGFDNIVMKYLNDRDYRHFRTDI